MMMTMIAFKKKISETTTTTTKKSHTLTHTQVHLQKAHTLKYLYQTTEQKRKKQKKSLCVG